MDSPILAFIRDRFESLEGSQTGIHTKLDNLTNVCSHLDKRLTVIERGGTPEPPDKPKASKAGWLTGIATFAAAVGYELYGFWSKKP
jgi:hypothetical protein